MGKYKKILVVIPALIALLTLSGCSIGQNPILGTSNTLESSISGGNDQCINPDDVESDTTVTIGSEIYQRVRQDINMSVCIYVKKNSGEQKDGKFIAKIGKTTDGQDYYRPICHVGAPTYSRSLSDVIFILKDNIFNGAADGEMGCKDSKATNNFDIYLKGGQIPSNLKCETKTAKTTLATKALAADDPQTEITINGADYSQTDLFQSSSEDIDTSQKLPKDITSNGITFSAYKNLIKVVAASDSKNADAIYLVKKDIDITSSEDFDVWIFRPVTLSSKDLKVNNNLRIGWVDFPSSVTLGSGSQGWYNAWIPESKPAIYLYPQKTEDVGILLAPRGGWISKSIPSYDFKKGWHVRAEPDGTIKSNNNSYPYLFYEAMLPAPKMPDQFVGLDGQNMKAGLFTLGKKLSLSDKEAQDLADYWAEKLEPAPYYQVGLMDAGEINKIEPLNIKPAPESILRIRLVFKKSNERPNDNFTVPSPFNRQGFTLVEWGGFVLN
jgi:hypothetical protein